MAEVQKHVAETTYDITGLTTRQAAEIEALLAQSADDPLMAGVHQELRKALQTDETFREREVVKKESVDFYSPAHLVYGYFTREKELPF